MSSLSTLLLDDTGDLLCACYEDGSETIVVGTGADAVAQQIGMNIRFSRGSIWFNRLVGIDRDNLFSPERNVSLDGIRAQVLRERILEIPCVESIEGDISIQRLSGSKIVTPIIPSVVINCEASRTSSNIGFNVDEVTLQPKVGNNV